MRFGSLFSGIGGLDLGLERAGMTCAWQSEIDPYASRVLKKHWPYVPNLGDIREVDPYAIEPVDLICGGFPCQPHSLAGRRLASEDDRDLWGEFARIIRGVKPRWVLAENVPGLLSSERGAFFGRVLRDLAELGFDVEWESIPAAAFGAPHLRYRVFIVAYVNKIRRNGGSWVFGAERGNESPYRGEILSDADGEHADHGGHGASSLREKRRPETELFRREPDVGDSNSEWKLQPQGSVFGLGRRPCDSGWWSAEPGVGRVAYGVPSGVDRLKCLGNGVVHQVPEWIGKRIQEVEAIA